MVLFSLVKRLARGSGIVKYDTVRDSRPRGYQSHAVDPTAPRTAVRKALHVAKSAANCAASNATRGISKHAPRGGRRDIPHRREIPQGFKENSRWGLAEGWDLPLAGTRWGGPGGGAAHSADAAWLLKPNAGAGGGGGGGGEGGRRRGGGGGGGAEEKEAANAVSSAMWVCATCTLHNEALHLACDACGSHKPW